MTRVQIVLPNLAALLQAAAERWVAASIEAMRARGRFHVALCGGSTPKGLYALLATDDYAARIDWSRVHLFWGDERCVPPTDSMSNYRMVRETLIDHVALPADNVHRIRGEDESAAAAVAYERQLRHTLGSRTGFDLVLLGMGEDGHTASLFPGLTAVRERERWVIAEYLSAASAWRISCTPILFNASAAVLFLVSGGKKAATLRQVLEGPYQPEALPAQVVATHNGSVFWLLDADAAADLTEAAGRP